MDLVRRQFLAHHDDLHRCMPAGAYTLSHTDNQPGGSPKTLSQDHHTRRGRLQGSSTCGKINSRRSAHTKTLPKQPPENLQKPKTSTYNRIPHKPQTSRQTRQVYSVGHRTSLHKKSFFTAMFLQSKYSFIIKMFNFFSQRGTLFLCDFTCSYTPQQWF